MNVSVIGLGKLGAPLAVCLASGGNTVYGSEKSTQRLQQLEQAASDLGEPQLAKMLVEHRSRLHLADSTEIAVRNSDVSFLIVPTPSHPEGHFELGLVLEACRELGEALAPKTTHHTVVLVSTVMPGDCSTSIIPCLEAASNKRCGGELLGFCYNPAFIALGSVIANLLHPDVVLIGETDTQSGNQVEKIHREMCRVEELKVRRVNTVNAEISKLSLNTYITMKISFANSLARLCMQTPDADARKVAEILELDSRVGKKYLQPGLAYGGPCFPRDTGAFESFARSRGAAAPLAQATARINQEQHQFLLDWTSGHHRGGSIAILGLAYKQGTPVTEESPGLALCKGLLAQGKELRIHDPEARYDFASPKATFHDQATECLTGTNLVVLTTDWPEFKNLPPASLAGKTVLDCWALLKHAQLPADCNYHLLGANPCHASQLS